MLTIFTLLGGYWCDEIEAPYKSSSDPQCGTGNYRIIYDKYTHGGGFYQVACCMNYKTYKSSTGYGIWCDGFSTTQGASAMKIGLFYDSSGSGKSWYCNGYIQKAPTPTPAPRTPLMTPKATLITLAQKRTVFNPLTFILLFTLQ